MTILFLTKCLPSDTALLEQKMKNALLASKKVKCICFHHRNDPTELLEKVRKKKPQTIIYHDGHTPDEAKVILQRIKKKMNGHSPSSHILFNNHGITIDGITVVKEIDDVITVLNLN